jgi:hypothetical protein
MIKAQTEVNALPQEEGDNKERMVLGLMLASDSTQLTSFRMASVWPVYLMFVNQPKQERVRPTCHVVHHLAYVPSVRFLYVERSMCIVHCSYSSVQTSLLGIERPQKKCHLLLWKHTESVS